MGKSILRGFLFMSRGIYMGKAKLKELRRKNGLKPTLFRQDFRRAIDELRSKKTIAHR